MKQTWMVGIMILTGLMIGGCGTESERLANMADRAVEMQAIQTSAIAKTSREMVELNRDVQSERKELNLGFTQLENDRREIQKQRRSDLVWAEFLQFLSIMIAASMPLFLCAYLVWAAMQNGDDSSLVNEVLMQELASKEPRLIAAPNLPAEKQNNKPKRLAAKRLSQPKD